MINTEEKLKYRYILIFAAVLVLQIILALACWGGNDETYTGWNEHQGIIRMHVIANSNSQEDQRLKLKVRDKILAYVGENTKNNDSIDETRLFLMGHKQELADIAEAVVCENGYDYGIDVELGVRWIKEKNYGDITFPAGNYEALNITIGKGQGENWWCVLFPAVCLSACTKEDLSAYLDEDEVRLIENGDGYAVRFKAIEIYQKIKENLQ